MSHSKIQQWWHQPQPENLLCHPKPCPNVPKLCKPQNVQGKIVAGNLRVLQEIGKGSFGKVHLARDVETGEKHAVKFESPGVKRPLLLTEALIYNAIQMHGGCSGIPVAHWLGHQFGYNVLTMDICGPNLEQLLQLCGGRFSLNTTLLLVDQFFSIFEYLHNMGFIHRDLKPENFVMGLGPNAHKVLLIDYGLATSYRQENGFHIPFTFRKGMIGTALYASINAQRGIELSRRDDIESIGYILMYFLRGRLPWEVDDPTAKVRTTVVDFGIKRNVSLDWMCQGYPSQFKTLINYSKDLGFQEKPNYKYLSWMFYKVAASRGLKYNYDFDWLHVKKIANKDLKKFLEAGKKCVIGENKKGKKINEMKKWWMV